MENWGFSEWYWAIAAFMIIGIPIIQFVLICILQILNYNNIYYPSFGDQWEMWQLWWMDLCLGIISIVGLCGMAYLIYLFNQ